MEKNLKANVVVQMKNVRVYEIIDNAKRQLSYGELKVLRLAKERIYLMTVGEFSYSLSKELPVMRSTRDQYVFPHFNGFIGILIPDEVDYELLEAFEEILMENTDFTKSKQRLTVHDLPRSMTFDLDAVKVANDRSKARKISMFIESSGEHIKRGIMRAATYTSEKMKKGGDYLKKNIKPKKNSISLTEKQSAAIEQLKTVSSVALMLSKAIVTGTLATTQEIGSWISKRFENSDTSKKLERSPGYLMAKELGKAGLSAAVTIYDGLEEALIIMGRSGSEVAVDVVEHTYGPDAGNATEETMKVLGNVGSILHEVHHLGIKTVAKTAQELNKEKK